jgi:circadian clock protein KaiC
MPHSSQLPGRTTTGVSGLDIVLAGGLLNRSTYLIAGAPGTGKSVLSQQIAFHQARLGNKVLYLTLLSESHEKMLVNLQGFSFFDRSFVGDHITYLSLYQDVIGGGLQSFTSVAREAVLKSSAKLVIMDGVSSLRDFAGSRGDLRKSLFDFNAQLSALGCTTLLIVDDELPVQNAPEYAIADNILRLHFSTDKKRYVRTLEISKSRATPALPGLHYFDITNDGLQIYPFIEAQLASQQFDPPPPVTNERLSLGNEGLNRMVFGGLFGSSFNVILGTPGSGKTIVSLRFIHEGVRQGQKALILSLQHSPEQLLAITRELGFNLDQYVNDGTLKILWALPVQRYLDEVAGKLLQEIEAHKPALLLIDSITELERLSLDPDRIPSFWAAIANVLRNKRITTIGTMELNRLGNHVLEIPEHPISLLADTMLLMRSQEAEGQLKRLVSILEMRHSDFDPVVREYHLGSGGIQLGEPFVAPGTNAASENK